MSGPSLSNSTTGALSNSSTPAQTSDQSPSLPITPSSSAVNVASVRTHVPVTLDLKASNFTKWRMLVRVLLSKYELLAHVDAVTDPAARTPEWIREDYIVRSWLYGSISDEILDIIMAEEQTAQEAWILIRNRFLDNQMTRAVYLEAEFRAIVQGDLSVTAYCHHLKALSDALRDVGNPVTDQTLVLNCLRGLNPRFADITTIVTMQRPLPSFAETRSLLILRETQLVNSVQAGTQTALYGATSNGAGNRGNDGGGNWNNGNGGGNRNGRRKKNGGGNQTGGGNGGGNRSGTGDRNGDTPHSVTPPVGPWVCFNPYTGQTQQLQASWRPNNGGPGVLGARPGALPNSQAFTSLAPLHGQAFGTNPPPTPTFNNGAPTWDCTALMAALNNAAAPSSVGEWVMDSGATSHMASDPVATATST